MLLCVYVCVVVRPLRDDSLAKKTVGTFYFSNAINVI